MMKTYEATVTREGKWWMIAIPELDGLTQARRLAEVVQMARELIAVTLDIPISKAAVKITRETVGPVEVVTRVNTIRASRDRAARAERAAQDEARALAADLAAEGVPVRDIGEALGVSFQRAHQLVSS